MARAKKLSDSIDIIQHLFTELRPGVWLSTLQIGPVSQSYVLQRGRLTEATSRLDLEAATLHEMVRQALVARPAGRRRRKKDQ